MVRQIVNQKIVGFELHLLQVGAGVFYIELKLKIHVCVLQ